MDKITKKKRSQIMAAIRSKDTKPEVLLRKALFAVGLRFRIHVKKLPSAPDIVLPKYKSIILVHGCFWHGHFCKISRIPKSNIKFWTNKIHGMFNEILKAGGSPMIKLIIEWLKGQK